MSKPRPISPDPDRDGYQVVVSFRAADPQGNQDDFHGALSDLLERWFAHVADLDMAVREIGAQGEQSQMEGAGP
jgi:hypothetical protein